MKISRSSVVLSLLVVVLCLFTTSVGMFLTDNGQPFETLNVYGDSVTLYGSGIYAYDSMMRAPIFRGTDAVMLFLAVPSLLMILWLRSRRWSLRLQLMLVSMLFVFVYYSMNLVFGVMNNGMFLAYIALFSAGLFALAEALRGLTGSGLVDRIIGPLPKRGFNIFLVLTGAALTLAWIPDIITAMLSNGPLSLIEVYSTEVTYVIDIAIIGPMAIAGIFLNKSRQDIGYVILSMLLTLCAFIGIMLPMQTVFQANAGISVPVQVMVTKVASFCLLAIFATYLEIRLLKAIQDPKKRAL